MASSVPPGGRPRQYAGVNLFVKNLDTTFDDQRLWETFSKFGSILSCKVQLDENGITKGFGFVCFTNVNEASLAIAELNGRVVGTKPLYVNVFESKEERAQNRLKKAVEYSKFSPAIPKPTSYDEFLRLTRSRGRGRGRTSGVFPSPNLTDPTMVNGLTAAYPPFTPTPGTTARMSFGDRTSPIVASETAEVASVASRYASVQFAPYTYPGSPGVGAPDYSPMASPMNSPKGPGN